MKKQNFFQLILLLISTLVSGQEKEIEFLIPSIQSNITIDGVGNEEEWEKSDWQTEFWLWRPNDSLKANKQTRFKILKNEKNLYVFSDQRKFFNLDSKVSYGTFYNGTKFTIENEIKWRKQPIVNASMILNFNAIKLPEPHTSKKIWLVSPKIDFTFTKTISWTTFIQYNSQGENLGINSRMQWRFAPLSDLFLVYNDNYISTDNFSPRYRSFNLKLTYWINI